MNRLIGWCKKNSIYFAAFFMPFIALLAIFIGANVYPFGDQSFLHIDMYHQYFPMLVDFYRAVKGSGVGSNLFYSWSSGLGSNMVAEYAYYLATPLNWLCLLIPESHLMEFMSYLVVFKTGAMGVTMAYYLANHFNHKGMSVTFFSTFYALSGYMAAYNWDVMWLDVILLAPLVILGLERLVEDGNPTLYTITLGLSILSNYYLSIMLCIYLVFYYALVLFPGSKHKVRATRDFAIYSVLGGGMAAVLLIPTLMALQLSKFSAGTLPETVKTYFSIFDVLSRHLMDVEVETGLNHWPNIYCSVAVLILVPLYIMCSHINTREKIGKLTLAAFMAISFSSNILTYIWHGMNYPDSLPSRQSFLYILLILTISYEAFLHIKTFNKAELCSVFAGVAIFIIMVQKLCTDDAIDGNSCLWSAIFLIIYAILIYLYFHRQKWTEILISFVVLTVVLEAGINTMLTSVPTVSRDSYLDNYETYNTLYERNNQLSDGSLYRFENVDNRVRNDDSMLHNYMSTSLFSSTANGLVGAFYKNYGMRTSKVFYCYDGMTPLISGLLSVGYLYYQNPVDRPTLLTQVDSEGDVTLCAFNDSLPLGYMIHNSDTATGELVTDQETAVAEMNGDIVSEDEDLGPVERLNELAYNLGASGELYTRLADQYSGSDFSFESYEDQYLVAYCDTKEISTIKAITSEGDKQFSKYKNPYILDLGLEKQGEVTYIYNADGDEDLHLVLYRFNEDVYHDVMDRLAQDTMQITDFKATHFTGSVTASSDGYLVLGVPYDPGFTVYVDGEKVDSSLFLDMMLTVPVTQGEHSIEVKYFPQGLVLGLIVSLVCIGIFLGLRLLVNNKNRKS